tara:strand:+ start:2199 stop:3026 length:828 start_codon:yes stop_codon:yes gene_type:complete
MMKVRHNKKRNTAFLYESLIKELTKSIVRNQTETKQKVINILKEYFGKDSILKKDLDLYNTLLESKGLNESFGKRLIIEVKKDHDSLDRKAVFNSQTNLIKLINETLSNEVFANFLSNYKNIATIGQFFQSKSLDATRRLMLEDRIISLLTANRINEQKEIKHIDKLTYNTFVNKFNESYKNTLRDEQKSLLTNFITSFSDNGLGLKCFMNEEVGRLKSALENTLADEVIRENKEYSNNLDRVVQKLDSFKDTPINEEMVRSLFYIQDLVAEVTK